MKTTTRRTSKPLANFKSALPVTSLSWLLIMLLRANSASAAQLIWDPLFNNGTTAGSGNWDTTGANAVWYNGTSDVAWTQTGTTTPLNGAIFNGPDAAAGTYLVTNDAVQVAISNMQVNANGYAFSGANAIYVNSSEFLSIAANKTVTFGCNMAGSGTSPSWQLGSGATMNVTGNLLGTQQLRMAGPANSAFNLTGSASVPAQLYVLGPVYVTNGSITPTSSFFIGNLNGNTINGTTYTNGSVTIGGNASISQQKQVLFIARTGGVGTLTMQGNSVVMVGNSGTAAEDLAINYDGNTANAATLNVQGGTLTVGGSSTPFTGSLITFFDSTAATSASSTATWNQSGGLINAWGIDIGKAGGVGTASLTQTGGTLLVGSAGIVKGASYTGPFSITLSGGTVGALANWASSLPITLGTANGSITFQCANNSSSPFNISLSGPLTGAGGLYLTGGGILTLSGANNYAGSTIVSNGTLAIVTGTSPITNGPVTLDGTAGTPSVTVTVSSPGQYWTNNGSFTFVNAISGVPTANFQFGALSPSTTVAPIQVAGNVAFTTTPNVNVSGAAIATGTYPLFKYTGSASGTIPGVNVNLSGGFASGFITNITAMKTIALVINNSTYNPAVSWSIGNGLWDNTTSNWSQFGHSTNYVDGDAVVFDDSASGPSPITVTLNSTVNPLNVTFNNAAPTNYTITGNGSIAGNASVSVLGSGTASLASSNTYNGGTVISAGQLNINNGGSAFATAIGTGTLTLNSGATIDNTSGLDVTLQANIPETWNGNFGYAGSVHNFNTGIGQITMNGSITISNGANNFTVGGTINDDGFNYALTKTGNGALTLPVPNNFNGGMNLSSGLLNVGDPGAVGSGILNISGGAIDNNSGAGFTLSPASFVWSGSFTFVGSTNLGLLGNIVIPNGLGNITVNMASNTLTTTNDIANNNTEVIKTGNGTWEMGGAVSGLQSLGLVVNAGQVNLHRLGGQAITGGNNVGLTVNTGALVLDEGSFQIHSDSPVPLPVSLAGGTWDLNGFNENVDELSLSAGGTLRMGASSGTSTLNLISGYTASLSGPDCQFDVTTNGTFNFKGPIGGSGSLVKIGAGVLSLESNSVYTGNTVISNGTIALFGFSSISNTAVINLAVTNSILDLSSNVDINSNSTPVLVLQSGQTLSGFGTVNGLVQANSGSTLAPGTAATIGTLTVSGVTGTNTLSGTTAMKLNKSGLTNDQLSVSGGLVYGGTLELTNLSGSLANGDSFALFSAGGGYSGAFASLNPPRPGYPGFGLAWKTSNLAINGILSVMSVAIPASPKITGVHLTGSTLAIHGTNGVANEPFIVLESASVKTALTNWVPVLTNAFDGSGNFSVSFGTTNNPAEFYAIWMQ